MGILFITLLTIISLNSFDSRELVNNFGEQLAQVADAEYDRTHEDGNFYAYLAKFNNNNTLQNFKEDVSSLIKNSEYEINTEKDWQYDEPSESHVTVLRVNDQYHIAIYFYSDLNRFAVADATGQF